ncbi:hypothetical protein, partial [Agromyces humi]|uniref:hypothetical protein n=1 Tax=Agromyces humi TaxID=1766800 RepID=UPI00135905AF
MASNALGRRTRTAVAAVVAFLTAFVMSMPGTSPAAALASPTSAAQELSVPVTLTSEQLLELLQRGEHQDAPDVGPAPGTGVISDGDLWAAAGSAAA